MQDRRNLPSRRHDPSFDCRLIVWYHAKHLVGTRRCESSVSTTYGALLSFVFRTKRIYKSHRKWLFYYRPVDKIFTSMPLTKCAG